MVGCSKEIRSGVVNLGLPYEELTPAFFALQLLKDTKVKNFKFKLNPSSFGKFDDLIIEIERADGQNENLAIQLKHRDDGRNKIDVREFYHEGKDFEIEKYRIAYEKLGRDVRQSYKFILFTNATFENTESCRNHKITVVNNSFETSLFNKENVLQFKEKNVQKRSEFFERFFLFSAQMSFKELRKAIIEVFTNDYHLTGNNASCYMNFFSDLRRMQYGDTEIDRETVILKLIDIHLADLEPTLINNDKMELLENALRKFDVTYLHQVADKKRNIYPNQEITDEVKEIAKIYKTFSTDEKISKGKLVRILGYFQEKPIFVSLDDKTKLRIYSAVEMSKLLKTIKIKFVLVGKKSEHKVFDPKIRVFHNLMHLKTIDASLYENIIKTFKISLHGRRAETIKTLQTEFGLDFDELVTPNELFQDGLEVGAKIEALPKPYMTRFLKRGNVHSCHLQQICDENITTIHCDGSSKLLKSFLTDKGIEIKDLTNEKSCTENNLHHLKYLGDDEFAWEINKVSPDAPQIFDNQLNVICGNPGIGKTTMMKYLANKCPLNYWVVNVPLKQLGVCLKNEQTTEKVLNVLTHTSKNIDHKIMKCLQNEKKLMFFFDGLDELNNDCIKGIIRAIQLLLNEGYKCWISCTKRLRHTLENNFKLYSIYDIEETNEEDQKEYLRKKLKDKKPKEFIDQAIEKIFRNDANILKVPLCLFILAEIISKSEDVDQLENLLNLSQMYSDFIDGKFKHKLEKAHYNTNQDNLSVVIDIYKHFYMKECQIGALKACLEPAHFQLLDVRNDKYFLSQIRGKGDFVGLISDVSPHGNLLFTHFTFAQYFSAIWLSENFQNMAEEQRRFLFEPEYLGIRYFLNVKFAENCPLHLAILDRDITKVKQLVKKHLNDLDKGGRTPLHLASSIGIKHPISQCNAIQKQLYFKDDTEREILECLLEKVVDVLKKDQLFGWNSFEYADASLSLSSLEKLSTKENLQMDYLRNYKDLVCLSKHCVKLGYLNLLKQVTELKKLEALDKNKKPLLHLAIENGQKEVALFLINKGVDLTKTDLQKRTPLHIAAIWDSIEIVKFILQKGVKVDAKDFKRKTPLHFAAKTGHQEIVQLLLKYGAKVNNLDDRKRTPLHKACYMGKTEVVQLLLEKGADVNCKDNDEKTPLQRASDMGHENTVRCLIENQADINSVDKNKRTVLHYASFEGHLKVVEYLVKKKINVTARDDDGKTAAQLAEERGHKNIVKILQAAEHNFRQEPKNIYEHELHEAAKRNNLAKIIQLLHSGANIEKTNRDQETILHIASAEGHTDLVQYLLSQKANTKARNRDDRLPLHLASQHGHLEIVKQLLTTEDVNAKDRWKLTPLHRAAYKGHKNVVEYLIDFGADLEAAQTDGGTPLHSAAFGGHHDIIQLLIANGAKPQARNLNEETCLHEAALKGCTETVCYLIDKWNDLINLVDCNGRTALHWAAEKGYGNMIRHLVEAGADVAIKDLVKKTALEVAKDAGKDDVVRYLQEKTK